MKLLIFSLFLWYFSLLHDPGVRDSADEETPHHSCYITQVHEQLQVKLQEVRDPPYIQEGSYYSDLGAAGRAIS